MPKEANFSNIYKVYDLVNTVLTLGFDKSWRTKASKYIIGNNVLDLGSGTGAAYKQLENFNVIALDPDEKMLQLNKFSKKIIANAENIPLDDNSYFPMKMRCFINLELLLSCEMNGKQGNFEMNGEQIPSIGYLSEMMRRYRYPVGEYLHDLSSPLSGYSLQDFASQFYSGYGLQGFASQFSTHGSRHIADGFYIVVSCNLHLHHPSFVEITQEHRQHHILTPEEYGATSTTRLCHVIRPSKDTSLCRSYILLGIATAEDTFMAQFGDVKSTAILRYQDGYGTLLLSGKDSIWVSISGDTCALSIARYALWIDRDPDIYALRDQVSSDLLSCGHHRVDFEYRERCRPSGPPFMECRAA